METLVLLVFEFFKTGLFAVGGGLATLPFLYQMAQTYPWFDTTMLANMIAVSESTPGPIGVNMATYAGFQAAGVLGGVLATSALVLPSIIIVIIIARVLEQFKQNQLVNAIFLILRPVVTGLIAVAFVEVVKISLFQFEVFKQTQQLLDAINLKAWCLFGILYYGSIKFKTHPIVFIGLGAIVGIIMEL